jgi:hypothetical protein
VAGGDGVIDEDCESTETKLGGVGGNWYLI